jgi:hypothetical protein
LGREAELDQTWNKVRLSRRLYVLLETRSHISITIVRRSIVSEPCRSLMTLLLTTVDKILKRRITQEDRLYTPNTDTATRRNASVLNTLTYLHENHLSYVHHDVPFERNFKTDQKYLQELHDLMKPSQSRLSSALQFPHGTKILRKSQITPTEFHCASPQRYTSFTTRTNLPPRSRARSQYGS